MNYGCQSMVKKIDTIMIKRPENAFVSQENLNENWEKFKYFGCPDYEKVLKEYDQFEQILKDNVENIWYLPRLSEGNQEGRHLLPYGQGTEKQGTSGYRRISEEQGYPDFRIH